MRTDQPQYDHDATPADEPVCWQTPVDHLEPEAEVEDAPLDVVGIGAIPPNALAVFVRFLLPAAVTPGRWKTAACRLAALAHSLGLPEVASLSQTQLATELGVSRALLSLLEVDLRVFGGMASHTGKSDVARDAYATRAKAVWGRRGAQQAKEARAGSGIADGDSEASTVARTGGKGARVKS